MDLPEVVATSCCQNLYPTAGPNEGDLEGNSPSETFVLVYDGSKLRKSEVHDAVSSQITHQD